MLAQATAHPITGTHDSFRYGLTSAAQGLAAGAVSPLQARLEKVSLTYTKLGVATLPPGQALTRL